MDAGNFIDIGNVIFFLATFPQLISAYKNRKHISGLSFWMLTGYVVSMVFLGIGNYMINAYIATGLIGVNISMYCAQVYWIHGRD